MGAWVAAAGAVIGAIGSARSSKESSKASEKATKLQIQADKELAEQNFNRQNWLQQQDRKWKLEDEQRGFNYKEDAVGGFRQFAPDGAAKAPIPERTQLDTSGLATFDPNAAPTSAPKPAGGAAAPIGTPRPRALDQLGVR